MLLLPLILAVAAGEVEPSARVADLVGLTEEAAKSILGEPDVARREAKGALWTYRKRECVLFVYLAEKPGAGLQVTGASAGPKRTGDPTPDLDACLVQPKG